MVSGMFVASFQLRKERNERWAKVRVQGLKGQVVLTVEVEKCVRNYFDRRKACQS